MPNHVHLILVPPQPDALRQVLAAAACAASATATISPMVVIACFPSPTAPG